MSRLHFILLLLIGTAVWAQQPDTPDVLEAAVRRQATIVELLNKGNAAFGGELFEQAERYLDQALALMGEDEPEEQAVIFDHAGDIATALGKEGEARTHWQKVLELAPDNEEVRLKLEP